MEIKCTSHKFILCAISVPKIIKVGGNLTKFWQNNFAQFFGTQCIQFIAAHYTFRTPRVNDNINTSNKDF